MQKDVACQTDDVKQINEFFENDFEEFHIHNHVNEMQSSEIEVSALEQLMNWWAIQEE